MALYEEGDDVLIPAPYWVSYPDQVKVAGANPVYVPTREEDGFRLQARDLAAAITPNTKALILNFPCNPTGATYTREQLEEIAEVCVREQIWVISDEIYEKLLYDGQRYTSIASLNEKIKKLTVVINGFSKAFSMTGWRLGYAAGPREIIAACSKIQSHNTSNATSFVQKAAPGGAARLQHGGGAHAAGVRAQAQRDRLPPALRCPTSPASRRRAPSTSCPT